MGPAIPRCAPQLCMSSQRVWSLLLPHAPDINDLLEGLDGVLEHGLHRLHDAEAALHVVDLRLHAFNSFHLSCDLHKRLAVVEALQDPGSQGLLDVLYGGSLCHGCVAVAATDSCCLHGEVVALGKGHSICDDDGSPC